MGACEQPLPASMDMGALLLASAEDSAFVLEPGTLFRFRSLEHHNRLLERHGFHRVPA